MIYMLVSTQATETHRTQSYLNQKRIKQLECEVILANNSLEPN